MTQLQQAKEQCDKLLTLLIQVDDNEELVDELAQRLAQAIRMKRSYAAMEANATAEVARKAAIADKIVEAKKIVGDDAEKSLESLDEKRFAHIEYMKQKGLKAEDIKLALNI